MGKEPNIKVSVTCLTKNHEKYIRQALDGILCQQTSFAFEIIISDDASEDQTLHIVNEYAQKYPDKIRVISYTSPIGASLSAFNAMRAAKGEYLASCEGDDCWISTDKLQKQVDFLDNHPEYVGCYHSNIFIDDNSRIIRPYVPWISNKKRFSKKDFKGIFLPGQGCTWVRRNLFVDPSFDGSLIYSASPKIADRTNLLIWLEHGDFARIDDLSSAYRYIRKINKANATSALYTSNPDVHLDEYHYLIHLENYLNKKNQKETKELEYRKKQLCTIVLLKTIVYRNKRDKELLRQLKKSLRSYFAWIIAIPYFTIQKMWHILRKANR